MTIDLSFFIGVSPPNAWSWSVTMSMCGESTGKKHNKERKGEHPHSVSDETTNVLKRT